MEAELEIDYLQLMKRLYMLVLIGLKGNDAGC